MKNSQTQLYKLSGVRIARFLKYVRPFWLLCLKELSTPLHAVWKMFWSSLNPFNATVSLYTPWKHQKTRGFLMFSGGIEIWILNFVVVVVAVLLGCEKLVISSQNVFTFTIILQWPRTYKQNCKKKYRLGCLKLEFKWINLLPFTQKLQLFLCFFGA